MRIEVGENRWCAQTWSPSTPPRSSRSSTLGARSPAVAFSATTVEAVHGVLITAHAFVDADLDDRRVLAGLPITLRIRAVHPHRRVPGRTAPLPVPELLAGTNYCDV